MQISKISARINTVNFIQSSQKFNFLKPLASDTVSFQAKKQSETPMWDDFAKKFNEVYPNESMKDVMQDMISTPENKLGEGVKKIVYSIDGINDYVVAFFKNREPDDEAEFVPCSDPFPGYYFGQEIASNNANMTIMKKIDGETNSIPDWSTTFKGYVYGGVPVKKEDAEVFFSKILEVESFPLESYIDFARQVKYLTDRRIKIDLFNPNNILIDEKNKKITHFDLFEDPSIFHELGTELNGTQDMVNILTDALLHVEFAKLLSDEDRETLMQKTKSIARKCEMAGSIVGLSSDKTIATRTYRFLQDKLIARGRNPKYSELYSDFRKMYGIEE